MEKVDARKLPPEALEHIRRQASIQRKQGYTWAHITEGGLEKPHFQKLVTRKINGLRNRFQQKRGFLRRPSIHLQAVYTRFLKYL